MGDQFQGAIGLSEEGDTHASDVLAMLLDLGRDSRGMAAALFQKLNELTAEPDCSTNPYYWRAISEARDRAEELRDFMSWVDEDPVKLRDELESIAADLSGPVESDQLGIRIESS